VSSIKKPLLVGFLGALVGFVAAIGMIILGLVLVAASVASGDHLQPNEAWTAPRSAPHAVWAREIVGRPEPVRLVSDGEQIQLEPTIVTGKVMLGSTTYVLVGQFQAERGVAYTVEGSSTGAMIRKYDGLWGVLATLLIIVCSGLLFVTIGVTAVVLLVYKLAKGKPAPLLTPAPPQPPLAP